MHETASGRSQHTRLLETGAAASAFDEVGSQRRLDTIVAAPIERDNLVKRYPSFPVVP